MGESIHKNKEKGQLKILIISMGFLIHVYWIRWQELKKMSICTKISLKLTVIAKEEDEVEKQIQNLSTVLLDQPPGQGTWNRHECMS